MYEISLDDGANICQWEYWSGDGQKFILNQTVAPVIKGDANLDGSVTAADLFAMVYALIGVLEAPLPETADINGDNQITILDLILLKELLC